jgi:hypothetical protein
MAAADDMPEHAMYAADAFEEAVHIKADNNIAARGMNKTARFHTLWIEVIKRQLQV